MRASSYITIFNIPFMTPIYRQYSIRVMLMLAGVLLVMSLFNVIVDPFGYFGVNTMGIYINGEREGKPHMIVKYPHDALLVGNSKASVLPASSLNNYRFFNCGLSHASPEEMYYFLDHFARDQKLVLLGIDLGLIQDDNYKGDIFKPWQWSDIMDKTLNLKTVEYSFRTITSWISKSERHMENDGSSCLKQWFAAYDVENQVLQKIKIKEQLQGMQSFNRKPGTGMEFFLKISRLLKERHIPVLVYIPPLHEEIIRPLHQSTNWENYVLWKTELLEIFPKIADLSLSEYSKPENFFKIDPVHFKPLVGVKFINEELLPNLDHY
jgi:hypothetical protein